MPASNGWTHQQTGEFVVAIPAGGGGPGGSPHAPGVETPLNTPPGDASAQEHCQGSDRTASGGPLVLDVAEWQCVFPLLLEFGSYVGQPGTGDGVQ